MPASPHALAAFLGMGHAIRVAHDVAVTHQPTLGRPGRAGAIIAVAAELVEVKPGKGADPHARRSWLAAALAAARKANAPVVVAKLCRLSRDVAFISGLMAQKV